MEKFLRSYFDCDVLLFVVDFGIQDTITNSLSHYEFDITVSGEIKLFSNVCKGDTAVRKVNLLQTSLDDSLLKSTRRLGKLTKIINFIHKFDENYL